MISVHKSISRFAAFLLLATAIGLPFSFGFSSHLLHVLSSGHATLTADGTVPLPPPPPTKQS